MTKEEAIKKSNEYLEPRKKEFEEINKDFDEWLIKSTTKLSGKPNAIGVMEIIAVHGLVKTKLDKMDEAINSLLKDAEAKLKLKEGGPDERQ